MSISFRKKGWWFTGGLFPCRISSLFNGNAPLHRKNGKPYTSLFRSAMAFSCRTEICSRFIRCVVASSPHQAIRNERKNSDAKHRSLRQTACATWHINENEKKAEIFFWYGNSQWRSFPNSISVTGKSCRPVAENLCTPAHSEIIMILRLFSGSPSWFFFNNAYNKYHKGNILRTYQLIIS